MGKRSDPAVLRLHFPKEKWDIPKLRALADALRLESSAAQALDTVVDGQEMELIVGPEKARALARAFDGLIHAIWRAESLEKQVKWAFIRSKMKKKTSP